MPVPPFEVPSLVEQSVIVSKLGGDVVGGVNMVEEDQRVGGNAVCLRLTEVMP